MIEKTIGGLRIIGHSRAGEESVIGVPELNVCFDIGLAPREVLAIDFVCLTHGHADHAAGVHYYFSQRGFIGNAPGCVLAHPRLIEHIARLMEVWADIEGHHAPRRLEPIRDGEDFEVRRNLVVRAFTNNHGGPSLGFSAIEVKHKLKPEYEGFTGPQLVDLKRKGETIDYRVEAPLVCYSGDTADGPFFDLPHVRDAGVMLLECTFFDPDHVHRARAGRHLHVRDLPSILERLRNEHIVLTHITRRTALGEAKRILSRMVSASDMDRISILMDRRPQSSAPRDVVNQPHASESETVE